MFSYVEACMCAHTCASKCVCAHTHTNMCIRKHRRMCTYACIHDYSHTCINPIYASRSRTSFWCTLRMHTFTHRDWYLHTSLKRCSFTASSPTLSGCNSTDSLRKTPASPLCQHARTCIECTCVYIHAVLAHVYASRDSMHGRYATIHAPCISDCYATAWSMSLLWDWLVYQIAVFYQ